MGKRVRAFSRVLGADNGLGSLDFPILRNAHHETLRPALLRASHFTPCTRVEPIRYVNHCQHRQHQK